MRGRTEVKLGIKWGPPNPNGSQLNVHKTPGTSGYLPSLPFSLSLPFFCQSFSPSFSICLSLFSCYTTLKGLVDSDELQCPTGNMLRRLSLELGGACCPYGCAVDQLFYSLIFVFMCNHACVQVCVKDLTPATPTREFLSVLR